MANRKWGGGLADEWLPRPRGRNGRPGGVFWGAEEGLRRARLQHEHDGLHGSAHGSVVPGPDFHDDVSVDRELWRRSGVDGALYLQADRIGFESGFYDADQSE